MSDHVGAIALIALGVLWAASAIAVFIAGLRAPLIEEPQNIATEWWLENQGRQR